MKTKTSNLSQTKAKIDHHPKSGGTLEANSAQDSALEPTTVKALYNQKLQGAQRRDVVQRMNHQYGNQGVQRLLHSLNSPLGIIQREPVVDAPADPSAVTLTSPRFAGEPTLEECFAGTRKLKTGDKGEPVARIQQALLDLNVPVSEYGADGKFGPETTQAVVTFRSGQKLTPITGQVDDKVMQRLDQLFPPKPAAPPDKRVDDIAAMLNKKPPDFKQAFTTLNGLSMDDMLKILQDLKARGFLQDMINNLQGSNTAGLNESRLRVAMLAVKLMGIFSLESFKQNFKDDLSKVEPEGRYAVLHLIARNSPAIGKLKLTKGFQALGPDAQEKLLTYVGGINPEISDPARLRLETLLDDAKADLDDPMTFRKFLTGPQDTNPLNAQEGTFDGKREIYELAGPEEKKGYAFKSHYEAALKHTVKFGEKVIPIFSPKKPDPKLGEFHSVDEIGDGLAATPKKVRDLIVKVNIEPRRNPEDAYWEKEYKEKGFRSYMTAGGDGVVEIYPQIANPKQNGVDSSIIHETGHILSEKKWGGNVKGPRWKPWRQAMKQDNVVASGYAKNSPAEDFSEALSLYAIMQAKPPEERGEYRDMMPARFKILDALLNDA